MAGDWRETLGPGSILGNLHFIKRLGAGGMSEVFLAEDPKGARVAVKVLDPSVVDSESGFLDRFRHEAEFAKNVRHPNLVEVYGAARDKASGLCYLVMEYMPGGSLRDVLNANPGGLSIDGVDAAFYAFVNISATGMDSQTFAYNLLKEQRVAVVPGLAYGDAYDRFIRIAFTVSVKRLSEALARIRAFLHH